MEEVTLLELPCQVAHQHSNGDYCTDRQVLTKEWPIDLFTADQMREFARAAVLADRMTRLPSSYVNAANISGGDPPHVVVQKLDAAAIRKGE